ncbi:hypothetical protein CCAND38_1050002 [Capnocytophaga canis]|uniref:Type I restriction modification DNA specificity domain-containing protein n=1 Tax=Capnocytophaga canis TaxID=1848903 RepID=A0A0B7I113_9FLAO|nr:hypothetical protein CCAND38_1050002 [Capnocytophaga canis]
MVCIMNAKITAYYVDSFINSTSHCTTGDSKGIPIIIPTSKQLKLFKDLFDDAITIKRKQLNGLISEIKAEMQLSEIQRNLDKMVNTLYFV